MIYIVTYHRRLDCLPNRLFRRRSKKTSKLCPPGRCEGILWWLMDALTKGQSRGKCFHLWRHHDETPRCLCDFNKLQTIIIFILRVAVSQKFSNLFATIVCRNVLAPGCAQPKGKCWLPNDLFTNTSRWSNDGIHNGHEVSWHLVGLVRPRFFSRCNTMPLDCVRHPTVWGRFHSVNYTQHYSDVIMGTMATQVTSLTFVYSTVYSGADQRKHQSSASLAFVREIHWPVNSPHRWPVTRQMFPFDHHGQLECN